MQTIRINQRVGELRVVIVYARRCFGVEPSGGLKRAFDMGILRFSAGH